MFGSFTKVANGNIAMSVFVKLDTTNAGRVLACGANEDIWGISSPYPRRHALLDDGYAAIAGENLNVIGPGDDEALLRLGGTVTAGQRIKSDANGYGVAATADKDRAGAVAIIGGVSGELVKVKPMRFDVSV